MPKIRYVLIVIILAPILLLNAQRKELNGQLIAVDDVEGIHILNKTALKYAISDETGKFEIPAKVSDTIFISGLKYQPKTIIITNAMVESGAFSVQLIEKVNELNEVVIGKLLTGSLESDIENSDAKPEVNFYDLGIPGNTKLPLTLNEKRLHDADGGSWGHIGLGFGVNFHKLLNRISGRTKKLREIVAIDNKEKCIQRLRSEFSDAIFEENTLAENLKNEFFYFCQEDESFPALCEAQNDLRSIEFLKQKLIDYKQIRKSETKD